MKKIMKTKNKITKLNKNDIIFIIILIIIFIFLRFILSKMANKTEQINFILDNEIVKLENQIYKDENNVIYISKDDIEKIFDPTIYYNNAEQELITTYNRHIAVLKLNNNIMIVNDSNVEINGSLKEFNKKVYLPFSEMGSIYDLELEYIDSNYDNKAMQQKLIADSFFKEKIQALITKKIKLKEKPKLFSKKIELLEDGSRVTIIEEGEKYTKIRSANGNIGYIKTKKLSNIEKIRDNWINSKLSSEDVVILNDASDLNKNYSEVNFTNNKINVVVPKLLYLDQNLQVLDKTVNFKDEYNKYAEWCKSNNIDIWVTFSNNVEVSNSLRSYESRNSIINSLYYNIINHQCSGINVNFEKIDDINSFNRFIIELTPRFKELGIKVAVTYNKNIDEKKLENIVDFIIK